MLAMARRGGRREAAVEVLDASESRCGGQTTRRRWDPTRRTARAEPAALVGRGGCGRAGAIVALVVAANVVGGGDVGRSTAPVSTAAATVPVIASTVPAQPATTTPSVTVVAGPPNPPVILASAPAGYRLVEADLSGRGWRSGAAGAVVGTNPADPATSAWVLLTAVAAPTGSASGGSGTGRLRVPVSAGVGLLDVTPGGLSLLDAPIDGGGVQLAASGMDVAAMAAVINDTRLTGQGLAPSVGTLTERVQPDRRLRADYVCFDGPPGPIDRVPSADDGWIGVSVGGRADAVERAARAFTIRDLQATVVGGRYPAIAGHVALWDGAPVVMIDIDSAQVTLTGGSSIDELLTFAASLRPGTDDESAALQTAAHADPPAPGPASAQRPVDLARSGTFSGDVRWRAELWVDDAGSGPALAVDVTGTEAADRVELDAARCGVAIRAAWHPADGVALRCRARRHHPRDRPGTGLAVTIGSTTLTDTLTDPGADAPGLFGAVAFAELGSYHAEVIDADGTVLAIIDGT